MLRNGPRRISLLTPAKFSGIALAELQCPLADRLVRDGDATTGHLLFYVAKTQREPEVEPHDMTDDFRRVAEAAVELRFFHPATLQNFPDARKLTVPCSQRFRQYMDARDRGQLVVEHAGEREQVVALILQRHAYRADASRIIRLAPLHLGGDKIEQVLSNLQARTGQRQNVVAQPCGERPDVAGKCMRACLGMAGKCEPVGNVRILACFDLAGRPPDGVARSDGDFCCGRIRYQAVVSYVSDLARLRSAYIEVDLGK